MEHYFDKHYNIIPSPDLTSYQEQATSLLLLYGFFHGLVKGLYLFGIGLAARFKVGDFLVEGRHLRFIVLGLGHRVDGRL